MSKRLERWYLRVADEVVGPWIDRDDAVLYQNKHNGKLVRLVEIRDWESITANEGAAREQMAPWSMVDQLRDERDTAIERAEKAEAEAKVAAAVVLSRDAEIEVLRAFLKQFEDGGMSGHEVREAKADERDRFERKTAAKMLAALWGSDWNGDVDDATDRIIERARKLADIYFGAKEV